MNYKQAFPAFVLGVRIPNGFIDVSWPNEIAPMWRKDLPDGSSLLICIDYDDPAKRLAEERFMVQRCTYIYGEYLPEDNIVEDYFTEYHQALAWLADEEARCTQKFPFKSTGDY